MSDRLRMFVQYEVDKVALTSRITLKPGKHPATASGDRPSQPMNLSTASSVVVIAARGVGSGRRDLRNDLLLVEARILPTVVKRRDGSGVGEPAAGVHAEVVADERA